MRSLRWASRALQAVAPAVAVGVAERLFFTPPRPRASAALHNFLGTGRCFELRVEHRRVVGWRWGEGPLVYLVHGWGSRGGRLEAFVRPLLEAGFGVVTFDAPGHGASGRGMSSMPEFARAIHAVVEREGTAHAVIAHSLGAAATALAVSWGLTAERLV
jgi:pimeloyl-ACP methyl ester carboxylesterase